MNYQDILEKIRIELKNQNDFNSICLQNIANIESLLKKVNDDKLTDAQKQMIINIQIVLSSYNDEVLK